PSAPYGQSPGHALGLMKSAALADPARYGPLCRRYEALASTLWLGSWASGREVHDSYYKFNLGHSGTVNLIACETDPALYREYVKDLEIEHDSVAHHDNAWFDTVYGMSIPAAAPAMGPRVKNALDHWALRDRRGFTAQNSRDPSIARAIYSSPTLPGGPVEVAGYPI